MDQPRYGIKAASGLTGIAVETIRAWERRYGAVHPTRDAGGRRVYSAAEIGRLRLLKCLTESGHAIGRIADRPTPWLEELAAETGGARAPVRDAHDEISERVIKAATRYDVDSCNRLIGAALVGLPPVAAVTRVLSPMMNSVGECWERQTLSTAQEHIVTATVKRLVLSVLNTYQTVARDPVFAFGTLAGERHELGALFASLIAAGHGFRCAYLGPDIPAPDFAAAARRIAPHAVGVSVVHEPKGHDMKVQVDAFCRGVPEDIEVWLGGAALPTVGARHLPERCRLFDKIEDYDLSVSLVPRT